MSIGVICVAAPLGMVKAIMLEALEIKREIEVLADRLGKTQDYL